MHDSFFFFFFNDTATTEIYTLFLHDALPISSVRRNEIRWDRRAAAGVPRAEARGGIILRSRARRRDRKSTRLNSSHLVISYAVFCLKKKYKSKTTLPRHLSHANDLHEFNQV